MKKSLYMLCFIALLICSAGSFFAPAAHADTQEDFSQLSGLWVVDYEQTKELWGTMNKHELELFQLIAAVYMLDMDFSAKTMVEGTSFSENPRRVPFSVSRDESGKLLITKMDKERGEIKPFIWKEQSDGNMLVALGHTQPPISMMKCDYSKYAGRWRLDMPQNEALIAKLAKEAGFSEIEDFKAKLDGSFMTFSFSGGTFMMHWQTREGQAILHPFPRGAFEVSRYAKTDCRFQADEILLTFKSNDYIVFFFERLNLTMSLERVAE